MDADRKTKLLRGIRRVMRLMMLSLMLILLAYAAFTVYDLKSLTREGIGGAEYHNFAELTAINPDTAAWITVDGTHIDHPVVKGKDNFEYLDKGFDGGYYAGGSIFLDEKNAKDMSDTLIIIHGHHMTGGAMFGDLEKFTEQDFFDRHGTGTLLTPDSRYSLTAAGAGIVDAYESAVYHMARSGRIQVELLDECSLRRDVRFGEGDKLVVLSTCSGGMDSRRIVVMFRAVYEGRNS